MFKHNNVVISGTTSYGGGELNQHFPARKAGGPAWAFSIKIDHPAASVVPASERGPIRFDDEDITRIRDRHETWGITKTKNSDGSFTLAFHNTNNRRPNEFTSIFDLTVRNDIGPSRLKLGFDYRATPQWNN